MKELIMKTLTSDYTKVLVEEEFQYSAPHSFRVIDAKTEEAICEIHFQEGPIKECGVNGVANEDLLNMVLCRLQHFQDSKYSCPENTAAVAYIEKALQELRARTNKRIALGVEGTSAPGNNS